MKLGVALGLLALLLLSFGPAWSQGGQGQQKQQRPTLGPPEPSENEPSSATIINRGRLLSVHAIYVDAMDNGLGVQLAEELGASHRFRVVAKPQEADSVLRGTCFDSRRLRTLHSEVFLSDRASGASIWQDDVRRPLYPPTLKKAVSETADAIARHLNASLMSADHL